MRNARIVLSGLVVLLIAAGPAAAQPSPPPAVEGISIMQTGNQIRVTWDAVSSETPVRSYRIYFSTQSILDNNGLYDDFVTADGSETSFTFSVPPGAETLYVSVIAVDENGLESEYFVEEAWTEIGSASSSGVQSSGTSREASSTSSSVLHLLNARSTAPDRVEFRFSAPVDVDPAKAPEALQITDAQGAVLRIRSITIDGAVITATTERQRQGAVYRVRFSEPFRGSGGQPLDPENRTFLFRGFAPDSQQPPAGLRSGDVGADDSGDRSSGDRVQSGSPIEVQNLSFSSQQKSGGLYTVIADWSQPRRGELLYYLVYQTRDNGRTFSQAHVLPVDIRGVRLQGVTPGPFGLYIRTVSRDGTVSHGVFENVILP